VRDDLALAAVLGTGARVEEASLDGDEGIVEVPIEAEFVSDRDGVVGTASSAGGWMSALPLSFSVSPL
jgi:hypothetical protein